VEEGGRTGSAGESVLNSFPKYESAKAPCICVEGPNAQTATHGEAHDAWSDHLDSLPDKTATLTYTNKSKVNAKTISYGDAVKGAKKTAKEVAPHCSPACIAAQVNQGHLNQTQATDADNEKMLRRTMGEDKATPDDDE